jgi:glucokinase
MTQQCQIVADIGGTNARFACVATGSNELQQIRTLQTADFPRLIDAIRTYLSGLQQCKADKLCLALAGPVAQDQIQLTNNAWAFSRSGLEQALGMPVLTINDFSAQAYCLDTLQDKELDWFGAQRPQGGRMRAMVGPGTGLGVAGISPDGDILPSEGGHQAFAPVDAHEMEVLKLLWRKFPRVSSERLLSGPGLGNLYWANSILAGAEATLEAPAITAGALQGDTLCLQTISDFLDILASVAGDLALVLGALDGVYLSGGILPRLLGLLDREKFRRRFAAKGRFHDYCARMPLALVTAEQPGLRGCVAALRRSPA